MANTVTQKRGLTTFGWLALGGVAAAPLSSKARRDKVINSAKDLAGKVRSGSESSPA
ncbi:MAG: hypothetical protein ABWX70_11455 [Hyphomicrobium sp.]